MKTYNNYFGKFGGRYVAEILVPCLEELEQAFVRYIHDENFQAEILELQRTFVGRPTPLLHAKNVSQELAGAQVYIKLEGLAATGAHKINNALGQAVLAKRMGKKRIIAETGAGQHGLAVSAVCAQLQLPCRIYMGEVDIARQRPNVYTMELFGAEVVAVRSGSRTLKDAVNEALRDWMSSSEETHYIIGSALGPSPFPDMVREFQAVIGKETQSQAQNIRQSLSALIACVGGGSNAIGFFHPFIELNEPQLIAVEAGGRGSALGEHATRMSGSGKTSIVQGYKSTFLLNADGQLQETHSISAGLDYPGIGPQLAQLHASGRVKFYSVSDAQALEALKFFAQHEGVLFALESAHAAAFAMQYARTLNADQAIIVNMSGRGEKDLFISAKELQTELWSQFLQSELDSMHAKRSDTQLDNRTQPHNI